MKGKYSLREKVIAGTLALAGTGMAIFGTGCAQQKPATYEQREKLYDKLMKDDGTSFLEAKTAVRMYFDTLNNRLINSYSDEQKQKLAKWRQPLMQKIKDFYKADGDITVFAQIKEGEGKNAVMKSIGGREKISLGTLEEFKSLAEDFYKGNQEKLDEVLRGIVKVSQPKYNPVGVHRNRQYVRKDFENKFKPIDMDFFEYILKQKNGRIGKEENPGAQINKNDGTFVRAALGAVVYKGTEKEEEPSKEKSEEPAQDAENGAGERNENDQSLALFPDVREEEEF